MILSTVAGTDISLDYFYEAGADASEFIPKKKPPKSDSSRSALPNISAPDSKVGEALWSVDSSSTLSLYSAASCSSATALSKEEWMLVVKSRRTHVHSRLALERLSSLLIGELENTVIPGVVTDGDMMVYTNQEYRRYAIVSKELLTSGNAVPVYKVKFSLLYPYGIFSFAYIKDVRAGQPDSFTIGDAVEIQVKVDDHFVSRYYTPISGDLSAFEVIIKERETGIFTPLLLKQKPGARQIKIRGLFNTPILVKTPYGYNFPDNLVFITGILLV
jgi:hypothetical protein